MTVSGDRAGEGERIRDEGRSSDFSRMHRGCWLWDAGHSWVVNNTRVNHPRALSHTDTHAHGIHRHTPMHSDICMHSHTRAHTNMQSENNVYWWRAFACVKLREAVHQVTAVVISSWAPGCNRLPHFTHTHTHTHPSGTISHTHSSPCYLFMILLRPSSVTTCRLLHHMRCATLWHDLVPRAFCQFKQAGPQLEYTLANSSLCTLYITEREFMCAPPATLVVVGSEQIDMIRRVRMWSVQFFISTLSSSNSSLALFFPPHLSARHLDSQFHHTNRFSCSSFFILPLSAASCSSSHLLPPCSSSPLRARTSV